MELSNNLSNNPFVALFGSEERARHYRSTHSGSDIGIFIKPESTASSKPELNNNDHVKRLIQINDFIEEVFLITIDDEPRHGRPSRCVFLSDLKESLSGQNWLDENSVEQALMERIMMDDPSAYVCATSPPSQRNRLESDEVDANDVVRYLAWSFCRLKTANKSESDSLYTSLYKTCQKVIIQSGRLAFQNPSIFGRCDVGGQFIELLLSNGLVWSPELLVEFFELVALEISANPDDCSLLNSFRPILDKIFKKFTECSLGDAGLMAYVELVSFFARNSCLALILLEYNHISNPNAAGSAYQATLFGAMLSFSCLPKDDKSNLTYFSQPSQMNLTQVESEENIIFTCLEALNEKIYNLMLVMLKMGGSVREGLLTWLGKCLHANRGRAKLSARHMIPLMFRSLYASDSFFLNLSSVFLRLSAPFTDSTSPRPLKIQPSYCIAAKGNAQQGKFHMTGLDETTLIPDSESESRSVPPVEESYSFTTECFFMTHYCFKLGFCVLQEHFLRLNQDLTQMQHLYQDVVVQDGAASATGQQIKQEMEKATSVFLCHKAALTQPSLLRLALDFQAATAKFLTRMTAECDVSSLAALPEFLAENIQEFLLFVHRFKDPLLEERNSLLEHFLDFILSFMASPDFMSNPHLRAGMAESLGALLPSQSSQQSAFQTSHFYRNQLFETHPHINRLPEVVISAFVSIEVTGQAHFEDKFKYRQPMYQALEFMWGTKVHREIIMKLADYAERHVEDTEAPLFLRFINLLVNDAIYLLDEALSYMSQIKEKQQARDSGAWNQLAPQQRQETESGYRHLSMLARFHNIMARRTIESLEMITQHVKTIFIKSVMVDRVAAMLNYFLLHLVGPKKKNLKVKNFEEFQFVPKILVSNICRTYINLGDYDRFCAAVSQDGRSYSSELFEQAEEVLWKIHDPPERISSLNALSVKIKMMASRQAEDEELLSDIPDEYLDPIMGTLMTDPVLLPTSGKIVDRQTIARHILSDQTDPFNRMPMTMNMVKPAIELKQVIEAWISEMRQHRSKQDIHISNE